MTDVGPFRLQHRLGQGGGADVWAARHIVPSGLGEQVAIKLLRDERAREPDAIANFRREVRAVAALEHPHVLAVLDHGVVDLSEHGAPGSPWLAMPLMPGGSLSDRCGALPWPEQRAILGAILGALAHAHARGVIHRDLKPSNLLFGPRGVQLADFGIAHTITGADSEPWPGAGTPAWMAPEQFEGRWRDFGPWTDLYALGCVAWALACGRRPFDTRGRKLSAAYRAHSTWPAPRLRPSHLVPPALEGWIHRLMAKQPSDRYRHAADALRDLKALDRDDAPPQWPRTWPSAPDSTARHLSGAGLGLYGLREIPMVGRSEERDALWAALTRSWTRSRVHVAWLEGPAGTGKSRLARWIAETAAEAGMARWLHAVHSPGGGPADGLAPMARRLLRADGLEDMAIRDRALPWVDPSVALALSQWLTGHPGRHHGLLRELLASEAADRPLILWLDDVVRNADTVDFLAHLLQADPERAILVVLTARTEDLAEHPAQAHRLRELLERAEATTLTLGALPPALRETFVEQVLGLRGDLAARVAARTAGNPLFAVQLVGDWVQRGLLEVSAGGFHLADGADVDLPEDVHDVWTRRIDRILAARPADAQALELAAILGTHVDSREWRTVCTDAHLPDTAGLLDALTEAGLAAVDDKGALGSWSFVHDMLRESVVLRVRANGREIAHHVRCAAMLRRQRGRGIAERLGRHLRAAGSWDEAIVQLSSGIRERLEAGEFALAEVVSAERVAAIQALDPPESDVRWSEGWLLSARLARERGRTEEAHREVLRAIAQSAEHGWGTLHAEALAEAARVAYRSGRLDDALRRTEEAQEVAKTADVLHIIGSCLELRARALADRGRLDEADAAYAGAIVDFEAHRDRVGIGRCRLGRSVVAMSRGDLEAALAYAQRGRAELDSAGARLEAAIARNILGDAERMRGDLEAAATCYREALSHHRAWGSVTGGRIARLNLAQVLLEQERWPAAREWVLPLASTMRAEGAGLFLGAAHLMLMVCAAGDGTWTDWEDHQQQAEDLLEASGLVHPDLAALASRAGDLAEQSGEASKARAAWRLAIDQWTGLGREAEAQALRVKCAPDAPL